MYIYSVLSLFRTNSQSSIGWSDRFLFSKRVLTGELNFVEVVACDIRRYLHNHEVTHDPGFNLDNCIEQTIKVILCIYFTVQFVLKSCREIR